MTDLLYQRAWMIAQQVRDRASAIDATRLSAGTIIHLTEDLSKLARELRPAFRKTGMGAHIELLEGRISALRRAGRDIDGAVDRLNSAAYGIYMDAYSLAHPVSNGSA